MLTKTTGRLFAFAALATATTFATEYTWTGNGNRGDWSDTANWSPSAIPGAGDKAVFVLSEDMTISTPVSIPGGDALDIHVSGANLTLSGVVSGEGKLCKSGDKRLLLMSENTYAGGTVISNGTMEIWNLKALGTSTAPVHLASDGGSSVFGRLQICANGDFGYPVFVDKTRPRRENPATQTSLSPIPWLSSQAQSQAATEAYLLCAQSVNPSTSMRLSTFPTEPCSSMPIRKTSTSARA